jgi:diguanylate cyclase (GGDEF)-like protein
LRQSDILARFGGEEFLVLLPQTSISAAIALAERLRLALERQTIQFENSTFSVDASFGITEIDSNTDISLEAFYRLADRTMYLAKDLGGNTVCVSLSSEMT